MQKQLVKIFLKHASDLQPCGCFTWDGLFNHHGQPAFLFKGNVILAQPLYLHLLGTGNPEVTGLVEYPKHSHDEEVAA